jgi:hypothetical protein
MGREVGKSRRGDGNVGKAGKAGNPETRKPGNRKPGNPETGTRKLGNRKADAEWGCWAMWVRASGRWGG